MVQPVRVCRVSGERFHMLEAEHDLLRRLSERNPQLGAALPPPTIKPAEVGRRILAWGNLRHLFHAKSALSGVPHLSRYNPRDGYHSVTQEEFWDDRVDNIRFGRSYDFSRPFFDQYAELIRQVWCMALSITNSEGSDYCNGVENIRDCYLCFSAREARECMYGVSQYFSNDCVHCVAAVRCQYCYGCVSVDTCYECRHCRDCWSCSNCVGCLDCRGCSNCIGCVGLRQAQYCLFNEAAGRSGYEAFLAQHRLGSFKDMTALCARCEEFIARSARRVERIINAEDCSGSYIVRSANVCAGYQISECRDCGYLTIGLKSRDCWKGYALGSELCYAAGVVDSQNCAYSYGIWGGEALWYCYSMFAHCSSCFGCAALRGKSYCILNKQYSQAEYFELVARIVQHMRQNGEWGECFPPHYAPHSYQESWLADYLEDLPPGEAARRGYRMRPVEYGAAAAGAIEAERLPDDITSADLDQLGRTKVRCPLSGRVYNFQRKELEYYRRHDLPLPRLHWSVILDQLIAARDRMPDDAGCLPAVDASLAAQASAPPALSPLQR